MTPDFIQRRRVWITFILMAFSGVSILTYQFLDFDNVRSLSQVTKRNTERIQPRKPATTLLTDCNQEVLLNLTISRTKLLKTALQSNGNTFKYPVTKIPICINTKIQESICKHNLYWSKEAFTTSWKEMIQPCLGQMEHMKKVNRQNLTSIENSDMIVEKNIDETVLYIKIFSRNRQKELKRIGGDSWNTKITTNNISFTVDMLDKNDGSYETFISVPADGQYTILITVLQSICEGFMDLPKDYFQKGKSFLIMF